ncbi:MAG TPA: sensor histidine kinase [Beutenbergiaceae bacterium]|nr:sensor histidine kinase [Beutenbergiaceae bacterium]
MSAPAATPVPWLLRLCLHLLVAGLLVLIVVRAVLGYAGPVAGISVAAAVLAVVYTIGPLLPVIRRARWVAAGWLLLLLGTWVVLLGLTPDAIWLAFAWFFLLLHLLPWRTGLVGVGLTVVIAVGGFAWHQTSFTAAIVIGPMLGAAVAVATVWGFATLSAESERRRALIAELQRTRADLAAAERQHGVLAERERLAREIHDTLAQGLSSIQLLLRAAGRRLDDFPALAETAAHVEQARTAAQENLDEARRLVQALAPAELQGGSLVGALQRVCAGAAGPVGSDGPHVAFHQQGDLVALSTPVEVALLRIAQSAVANARQHAHATRVAVTLTTMDQQVTLDVVDDGVGFDPASPVQQPGPSGGFGLSSMRSRAAEFGGVLSVESTPGAGTAVAVTFPLAETESR